MNIYTLSTQALVRINGADAFSLLQGQLTADLNDLNNSGCISAYCNRFGKVLHTFYVYKHNDAFYIRLPHEQVEMLLATLGKYAVFSKVKITHCDQYDHAICTTKTDLSHNLAKLSAIEGKDYIRLGLLRPLGHTEYHMGEAVYTALVKDLELNSDDAWRLYEMQHGICMIDSSQSNQWTVHQLKLNEVGGVSLNKGCYIGQEIIARTHYRGSVKRRVQYYTAVSESMAIDELASNQESLAVLSSVYVNNSLHMLVMVSSDAPATLTLTCEHMKLSLDHQAFLQVAE